MDASAIPTGFAIVTGSDTTEQHGNALIFTGGTCAIIDMQNRTTTIPAAFAGIVLPIQHQKVMSTNTTATAIGQWR